jgi:hypothetical protein
MASFSCAALGEGLTDEGVDADPPHVCKEAVVEEEEADLITSNNNE